jgi:hypothetical protein
MRPVRLRGVLRSEMIANLPMFGPPHRMGAFSEMATGLRS